MVLFSIVIFHLGNLYKRFYTEQIRVYILFLGIPALLSPILIDIQSIDIFLTQFGTPFIALICSIIGVLFIIEISKILSEYKYINHVLAEIGKASLIIMALHLPINKLTIIPFFGHNPFIATFISITLSYLIYRIFNRLRVTQIIFLGKGISEKQIQDFLKLTN